MRNVIKAILGDPQKKTLKRLEKKVAEVNEFTDAVSALTDKQLKEKTKEFIDRIHSGETLDDIAAEAFAVVREAADRVLGLRPFDVQVLGGYVLHEGSVAEMRTGEGKTLVATLPVYLNALSGKGVHVVTVNDYLAQRDAGWMGKLYDWLGLSVGVIIANQSFLYDADYDNEDHEDERMKPLKPAERPEAYRADITYGTNNEFGFDYLRDNMETNPENLRQRGLNYSIVDEVDSILIDEARTPLIISSPAMSSGNAYGTFAKVARQLTPEDYELDEKRKAVTINDSGIEKVEKILGINNLYSPENVRSIYHLEQALRAETLFKRDRDYVVSDDGEVIIVDEFTGRLMHGRRYNEGLHQAIEAKEGVDVLQESMTLATISFQNYFRLYSKLSGMTGTAATEAEEFFQIYKLDVVEVPTNKPIARVDHPDRIYKNQKAKWSAVVERIRELQDKGQPVLVGTSSIENNELISRLLTKAGIDHSVLNAKHHEHEASIVAKAGQKGSVTIATNIAGRGTDIVLGEGVRELGGLFVLGTERNESRRIDNQLRGRAGRQGDPGETQFYVAADDDLMRIFGGERIEALMNRLGVDESIPIENRSISKSLEGAQKKVEGMNFDRRKNVVQYDDVMNKHRKSVYSSRQSILHNEDIKSVIDALIDEEVSLFKPSENEDMDKLVDEATNLFNLTDKHRQSLKRVKKENFASKLSEYAKSIRDEKEEKFGADVMRQFERQVHLQVIDSLWMEHLENMHHLREGINWRSVGQRDPLVEYRREGQRMFEELTGSLRTETVRMLFNAEPRVQPLSELETELSKAAEQATENAAAASSDTKVKSKTKRTGLTDEEKREQKRKARAKARKKKQKRKRK